MYIWFYWVWFYQCYSFSSLLDSKVWGFGWKMVLPIRFLPIRSIITIYFMEQVNSDLAQVSFFRRVWISCIRPCCRIFGLLLYLGSLITCWSLSSFFFSDELHWRSHRQEDTWKQAGWSNGILGQSWYINSCQISSVIWAQKAS